MFPHDPETHLRVGDSETIQQRINCVGMQVYVYVCTEKKKRQLQQKLQQLQQF